MVICRSNDIYFMSKDINSIVTSRKNRLSCTETPLFINSERKLSILFTNQSESKRTGVFFLT